MHFMQLQRNTFHGMVMDIDRHRLMISNYYFFFLGVVKKTVDHLIYFDFFYFIMSQSYARFWILEKFHRTCMRPVG